MSYRQSIKVSQIKSCITAIQNIYRSRCPFNHFPVLLFAKLPFSFIIFSCPCPSRSVASSTVSLLPFAVLHGQQTSGTQHCLVHLTVISIPSLFHWRSERTMAKATTSTWSTDADTHLHVTHNFFSPLSCQYSRCVGCWED